MSNISSEIILAENLEHFSPVLKGFLLYLLLFLIVLIPILVILIHRGVYYLLKRFDSRPINFLIKPVIFFNCISIFPYTSGLALRAYYYPIVDLTGPTYCHFHNFWDLYSNMLVQFQTFFITFFRYLCLFHGEAFYANGVTPKVSTVNALI